MVPGVIGRVAAVIPQMRGHGALFRESGGMFMVLEDFQGAVFSSDNDLTKSLITNV